MNTVLDGKLVASVIYDDIRSDVRRFNLLGTLAIITIGEDDASKVYVNTKKKRVEECGYRFMHIHMSQNTNVKALENMIMFLNDSEDVHGIMVQKPLPSNHLKSHEDEIDSLIIPSKDVDGFSPNSDYLSCTPKGIIDLLDDYEVPYVGKNVVIAGRSKTVAKPLADLLMEHNCTVTMIHSKTHEGLVKTLIKNCDVFVSAIGKPKYWKEEYFENTFKKIALVDVGINRDEEGKLCGDVDPEAYKHFDFYTPVPGGVGVMTVASLVSNLHDSVKRGWR